MELWQSIVLGIVEGITEFLPISSTGHLILTSKLLGLNGEFAKSFEIAIQSGAILSVLILYGRKLLEDRDLAIKTLVAFVPTGILGLLFYKLIKEYLLGNTFVVVVSLFIGGILLIVFELYHQKRTITEISSSGLTTGVSSSLARIKKMSYKDAIMIGLIQSVSMVPGVSRAAATILGALFLGFDRKTAVEFSFLLAIPTLLAATSYDLLKSANLFSYSDFQILGLGFVASFIVATLAIKWFVGLVKTNTLIPFGIYRIILSIVYILLFLR